MSDDKRPHALNLLIIVIVTMGGTFGYYIFLRGVSPNAWLLPLFSGLVLTIAYVIAYTITEVFLKSRRAFALGIFLVFVGHAALVVRNAAAMNLSMRKWGYDLFIDGRMTPYGALAQLYTPEGFAAICAIVYLAYRFLRQHIESR